MVVGTRDQGQERGDQALAKSMATEDPTEDPTRTRLQLQQLLRAETVSDVEKLLRPLELEKEIAKQLVSKLLQKGEDTETWSAFADLEGGEVEDSVQQAVQGMAGCIQDVVEKLRKARGADPSSSSRGNKFRGDFQGGPIEEFYAGVTGVIGEPNIDIKAGVRKEHAEMADSEVPFTTSNYGITTTPKMEYTVVVGFADEGGPHTKVPGTRRCNSKTEQMVVETRRCSIRGEEIQEDVRTLRPIHYYQEMEVVKKVGLIWVEIVSTILYTGPMFIMYNAILRGVGFCGEVELGVDLWSADGKFKQQIESVTVKDRMEKAGHRFASTIHSLASAVKKLQRVSTGVQGTWLYRGLGGLGIEDFLTGHGFTERAFTSTTKSLDVALEYSGAKSSAWGTVLAMEISEVDQGAVLEDFSQYPGEEETLWNAYSYMEPLRGKEHIIITDSGPVKLVPIKMNANGRALTVEELEHRRKTIVTSMLEFIQGDNIRALQQTWHDKNFKEKLTREVTGGEANGEADARQRNFLQIAMRGGEEMVENFRQLDPSWFHNNAQFAEAVAFAATLPRITASWIDCYLEDWNRRIWFAETWNFRAARTDLRTLRQRELNLACSERDDATRRPDPALGARIQRLALGLAEAKGFLRYQGAEWLDQATFLGGSATPLIEKCFEGDVQAVRLLMEARAKVDAQDRVTRVTPLHAACVWGDIEVVSMVLSAKADVEAAKAQGARPLHDAAQNGHAAVIRCLLKAKANAEPPLENNTTPLHFASSSGHIEAVRMLLEGGAGVDATLENGKSPLQSAARLGHIEVFELLLHARASIELAGGDSRGGGGIELAGSSSSGNNTPLLHASKQGHFGIVRMLLEASASLEACTKGGWHGGGLTALYVAASSGHIDSLLLLLMAKADTEATDATGRTALHEATEKRQVGAMRLLLEGRADIDARVQAGTVIDARVQDGSTSLHWCAREGHTEIVKVLIDSRADLKAEDSAGCTAAQLAANGGHAEVAELLESEG